MSILVTGGTGFIGSYLVKELLKEGEKIVIFDYMPDTSLLEDIKGDYKLLTGDISSLRDVMCAVLENEITDIFHLAFVLAETCEENPFKGFDINLKGILNLLEAARICNVKKFVFVSSISVFGKDAEEPVKNDAPKNPLTFYGITKLASEHICLWYNRKYNLDVRGVRFTWVFGPGRKRGITRLFSSQILDCIAKEKVVEIENPDEKGDWLYVKDAVKALLLAWRARRPKKRIYNIAGGTHSIREVVEIARRIVPDATVEYKGNRIVLSPYPSSYNDRWAREEFGWSPSYSIEDAVKEHLEIQMSQFKTQ